MVGHFLSKGFVDWMGKDGGFALGLGNQCRRRSMQSLPAGSALFELRSGLEGGEANFNETERGREL